MQLIIVTGISGSGKSLAIHVLEDAGYFCIDNLPVRYVLEVALSLEQEGHAKVAMSIDVRVGTRLTGLRDAVRQLRAQGHDVKVLFLNARTDSLVQRYSETRRRHPLTLPGRSNNTSHGADPKLAPTLEESIERERELMAEIEDIGTSIDTSDLHPNTLRQWVRDLVRTDRASMTLLFESFAFKQGVPLDADLVFDVRCLPNPYYDVELRTLTGLDQPVKDFLVDLPPVQKMIGDITRFITEWLPSYVQDNRHYLTIAIGCTGGQHRSVYVAQTLAEHFARTERVLVRHADQLRLQDLPLQPASDRAGQRRPLRRRRHQPALLLGQWQGLGQCIRRGLDAPFRTARPRLISHGPAYRLGRWCPHRGLHPEMREDMAEAAHGLPALGYLARPFRQTPEPAPHPAVGPCLQQHLPPGILNPQQVHGPHRHRLFPARLRIPLGLALLPGLAKRRQRTTPTVRPASGADHRPQVHQSLRVVDQVRRRGALGRQRGFGMRPEPRQRCAAGGVALHGKHPAQHALHVAIQNGSPLAEGKHRNGRCCRAPHTGQGLQLLSRLRKDAARIGHLACRRMQVARATVVAQTRP